MRLILIGQSRNYGRMPATEWPTAEPAQGLVQYDRLHKARETHTLPHGNFATHNPSVDPPPAILE